MKDKNSKQGQSELNSILSVYGKTEREGWMKLLEEEDKGIISLADMRDILAKVREDNAKAVNRAMSERMLCLWS